MRGCPWFSRRWRPSLLGSWFINLSRSRVPALYLLQFPLFVSLAMKLCSGTPVVLGVARVLRLALNPKGLSSTHPQRRGSDPSLVNHISRLPITGTPALAVMINAAGTLPWHGFAPHAANPLRLDPLVPILGLYAKLLDQRLILHIPSMRGFLANVDNLASVQA